MAYKTYNKSFKTQSNKPALLGRRKAALFNSNVSCHMFRERESDIEAVVTLLPTEEGGRQGYALSGYRPQHVLTEDWMTSGVQTYLDKEELNPGECALANIEFLSPLKKSLWVGREIRIQEGSRIVGYAKVTKVFNQDLLRNDS